MANGNPINQRGLFSIRKKDKERKRKLFVIVVGVPGISYWLAPSSRDEETRLSRITQKKRRIAICLPLFGT